MGSRIVVIFLGVPAIFGILAAGDLGRLLFFAVLACRGQFELFSMLYPEGPRHPWLEYGCSLLTLGLVLGMGERGLLAGASMTLVILACAVVLRGFNGTGYKRFALGLASVLYLPFCLGFFALLAREKGYMELFAVFCSIWALDIGAYLVGRSLRGPKLAPFISPNKTISGAVGGALVSGLTVVGLHLQGLFQVSSLRLAGLILALATVGQIADLFESVLKREAGVKDAGAILGNHGGLLDRVDSVVFLGPLSYFLLVP
jgi:phosphatidate cytidylyltransferase